MMICQIYSRKALPSLALHCDKAGETETRYRCTRAASTVYIDARHPFRPLSGEQPEKDR